MNKLPDVKSLDELGAEIRNDPSHRKRLLAARMRAQWEIGNPGLANVIIRTFLFPEAEGKRLLVEEEES